MNRLLFISFASAVLLTGCSSSQNPAAPIEEGEIRGNVEIQVSLSEYLHPSNITVTLDGGAMQTVTDSDGNWSFDMVPVGTHQAIVSKNGFGEMELYNIQVAPNGISEAPEATLCPEPTQHIYLDSIVQTFPSEPLSPETQWEVLATFDSGSPRYAIFVDSTPNVQPADAHLYSSMGTNVYQFYLLFIQYGFQSGQKLYMSACLYNPIPPQDAGGFYYDIADDQTRFIACGPRSNELILTVP